MKPETDASVKPREIDDALKHFDDLPESAQVRLPTVCALFGCAPATVWRGVRLGTFPAPLRLSPKITTWRVGTLRAKLNGLSVSVETNAGTKRARDALAAKRAATAEGSAA